MKTKAACLTAILVLSSSFALAGPVADAGQQAEALLAEGKTLEALDALSAAMDAICANSPLLFREVALVEPSDSEGTPPGQSDSTFRPDEKMTIYAEAVCFEPGRADTSPTVGFTGDLTIENLSGQVLAEKKDFLKLSAPARLGTREFPIRIGVVVPYIRPGEYKAIFTVHDRNSAKSGTFEVAFSVGLPAGVGETGQ
jgi:hypothetical protein